jgi:hypothetical protein
MWLAGGLFLAFLAAGNLRGVDRMLRDPHPSAALRIQALGAADARMLLRYQAAEQIRSCFETWEDVQLPLSLGFFFYLLFATREGKFALGLALLLIVVVTLQRFLVTPNLTALGRLLDFMPESAPSPYRGRFEILQTTYLGMEIGKCAGQLGLAALVITRTRKSSHHSRRQLDVVDKPDHGHVDR